MCRCYHRARDHRNPHPRQPPELEIRDVGELTMDQFRGIFRLTYDGDAHIVLRTKVQVRIRALSKFPVTTFDWLGKPVKP